MGRASSTARAGPLAMLSRGMGTMGTSLPIPTPPPGSNTLVFHSRMMVPKYSLSNPKWFALLFFANLGAYLGHYFYLKFMMASNPPNPPRNPDEPRPERHMHATDDDW